MPAAGPQLHARMVGGLIAADQEVESQLLATSHSHVLAASSAADARAADQLRRAARRRWETLRNIHDPRRRRHVHIALGFAGCVLSAAALTVLNRLELHAIPGGPLAASVVLATAGVWLGGAWCVALARRDDRRRTVVALAAAAVILDALLAALYALGTAGPWLAELPGVAGALLITGVAVVSSTLMEFTEPAFVASARWHWRRAEARYRSAAIVAGEDAESAAAATAAWLALIRARLAAETGGADSLMDECLAYAAAIVTAGAEARG